MEFFDSLPLHDSGFTISKRDYIIYSTAYMTFLAVIDHFENNPQANVEFKAKVWEAIEAVKTLLTTGILPKTDERVEQLEHQNATALELMMNIVIHFPDNLDPTHRRSTGGLQ